MQLKGIANRHGAIGMAFSCDNRQRLRSNQKHLTANFSGFDGFGGVMFTGGFGLYRQFG